MDHGRAGMERTDDVPVHGFDVSLTDGLAILDMPIPDELAQCKASGNGILLEAESDDGWPSSAVITLALTRESEFLFRPEQLMKAADENGIEYFVGEKDIGGFFWCRRGGPAFQEVTEVLRHLRRVTFGEGILCVPLETGTADGLAERFYGLLGSEGKMTMRVLIIGSRLFDEQIGQCVINVTCEQIFLAEINYVAAFLS